MSANANLAGWVVVGVGMICMLLIAVRAENHIRTAVPRETREVILTRRVNELENTVQTLLGKLNEAQQEIESLRTQLGKASSRISELEIMYEVTPAGGLKRLSPKHRLLRPLLVICGQDKALVGADLAMLDGIGIRYTRLFAATLADVSDEIGRAREDGRPYRWLLISAHAGPEGVQLKDAVAPADFWMRQLDLCEVIGIAACQGTNIADHLRSKADLVWFFRENVPNAPASRFVQKFFQRLNSGELPEAAFISCLDAVPEVAPFADYRVRVSK